MKKLTLRKFIKHGKLGDELYVGSNKESGYTAYFRDFPQIVSQGETIKEAQQKLWNTVYDVLRNFLDKERSTTNTSIG
jgi:hypothetical protein